MTHALRCDGSCTLLHQYGLAVDDVEALLCLLYTDAVDGVDGILLVGAGIHAVDAYAALHVIPQSLHLGGCECIVIYTCDGYITTPGVAGLVTCVGIAADAKPSATLVGEAE